MPVAVKHRVTDTWRLASATLFTCEQGPVVTVRKRRRDLPSATAVEVEELTDLLAAEKVLARVVRRHNRDRLHSALGYLRPADFYRDNPEAKYAERRGSSWRPGTAAGK
jgi:hypothetical protein